MKLRECVHGDEKKLFELIKELAIYENLLDQITGTEEDIRLSLFDKELGKALFVEDEENNLVGYVLYYYGYSTFLCNAFIYIEDIYIREAYRGRGYGTNIFSFFKDKCKEEKIERLEWACLDWNEPSLNFYKGLGAEVLDEWVKLRLTKF